MSPIRLSARGKVNIARQYKHITRITKSTTPGGALAAILGLALRWTPASRKRRCGATAAATEISPRPPFKNGADQRPEKAGQKIDSETRQSGKQINIYEMEGHMAS